MSNNQEVKHALRKMDFPQSATEALNKIAHLVCGRVPSIKSMDLANELISEFIFCEVDSKQRPRTHPTPHLSPIKELQLVDTLIQFLHNMNGSEAAKNTMFLFVFPVSNMAGGTIRMAVLTKMVSVSAALPSPVILRAASVAMQQIGSNSELSSAVCENIVRDYCELSIADNNLVKVLAGLPELVPAFAANLLTSISDMYLQRLSVSLGSLKQPPKALLRTITEWITADARLCVSAHEATLALPPGAIAMEATTPIAGLLRWCVIAPLLSLDNDSSVLYGRLHLALLYSMLEAGTGRAVSAQDLAAPIPVLAEKADSNKDSDNLQIALDRLAQAVQVALSSRCVYGNVDDLVNQLSSIRCGNRLVGIVVGEYKQRKEILIAI